MNHHKHIPAASAGLLGTAGGPDRAQTERKVAGYRKIAPQSATKNKSKNNEGFFKASFYYLR